MYCYKIDARVRRAEEISDITPNEDTQCSVKSEKARERERESGMHVIKVRMNRRYTRFWNEFLDPTSRCLPNIMFALLESF